MFCIKTIDRKIQETSTLQECNNNEKKEKEMHYLTKKYSQNQRGNIGNIYFVNKAHFTKLQGFP